MPFAVNPSPPPRCSPHLREFCRFYDEVQGRHPALQLRHTLPVGSGSLRWGGDDFGPITWALIYDVKQLVETI